MPQVEAGIWREMVTGRSRGRATFTNAMAACTLSLYDLRTATDAKAEPDQMPAGVQYRLLNVLADDLIELAGSGEHYEIRRASEAELP